MMSFSTEIKRGLEQIQQLQELYRQAKDVEIFPISFFSSAYDLLRNLTTTLHEIEATQLITLQEHLSRHESLIFDNGLLPLPADKDSYPEEFVKLDLLPEEDKLSDTAEDVVARADALELARPASEPSRPVGSEFLSDVIGKRLVTDLRKALSINDRFRFQRDLFSGDVHVMDETLRRLNECASFEEAIAFLDDHFRWEWEDKSVSDFKEILEKRFS